MTAFNSDQIQKALSETPQWKLNDRGQIERTFEFKDFSESLVFVNAIGLMAEKLNHHPDILILWNKVRLSVNTHDAKGLTEKDFDLAKRADKIRISLR